MCDEEKANWTIAIKMRIIIISNKKIKKVNIFETETHENIQ